MKSYEEMAETVFRRIDEYKERQKKRRKVIYTASATLACACLVAAVSFAAWKMKPNEPPMSLGADETSATENNRSNPITLQKPTEDITTPTEPTTPTIPTDPQPTDPPPGNGGTRTLCTIHSRAAHSFTDALIKYVGEENFDEWIKDASMSPISDGCRNPEYTVYECIKYFNIPKEVFEEINLKECYNVFYYDVDILYSGDDNAVEEFFRDKDTAQKVIDKRLAFNEIKLRIYNKYLESFKDIFGDTLHTEVTLYDMVRELNVPRNLLEDYASKTTTGRSYAYLFDLLYLQPGESVKLKNGKTVTYDDFNAMLEEAKNDPYPVRAADAIICGVEDYRLQ